MIRLANQATRGGRRWAALAAVAAAIPVAISGPALSTAPAAAAALPDQLKVVTLATYPGHNSDDRGGIMCTGTRTCTPVAYPYLNRGAGAEDLRAALAKADFTEPMVVFGYSQGARVVGEWLDAYANTASAPTPQQLSFVLIGNPGRKYGGTHRRLGLITPVTDYSIIDVTRQYDRASDWPDKPMNLLAFLNSNAGLTNIHVDYDDVDIYDPGNYVWKEGNTIYVFVPTENIPLLEPLRKMGLDKLADELNGPLKAKIEKGYDRSYLPDSPGWPPDLLPPIVPPSPSAPEPAARKATPLATALKARTTSAAQAGRLTEPDVETDTEAGIEADREAAAVADESDAADTDATPVLAKPEKKAGGDREATRKRPFARLFERATHPKSTRTAASSAGSASDTE